MSRRRTHVAPSALLRRARVAVRTHPPLRCCLLQPRTTLRRPSHTCNDLRRQWALDRVTEDPAYFRRLQNLQTPRWLWIGCADSRVPVSGWPLAKSFSWQQRQSGSWACRVPCPVLRNTLSCKMCCQLTRLPTLPAAPTGQRDCRSATRRGAYVNNYARDAYCNPASRLSPTI